jgi:predicted pyridoxine 5'-phosphate oxidase superfamily flavin-nucleotide-binding protein
MTDGAAIALLGIQLSTRRRNRVNGTVERTRPDRFAIAIEQAFGNCPRYIQRRNFTFVRDPDLPADVPPVESRSLDGAARAMIERADTFFIASYFEGQDTGGQNAERKARRRQVDVSHRGGPHGFVRVDDDGILTIPDFAGNRYYNTLGNITLNPRAGLVFADFESGDLLHMTGDSEVLPDVSPEGTNVDAYDGAEMLWRFRPRRIVRRPCALPLLFTTIADDP